MIRKARPNDIPIICELGIESLKNNGYDQWFVIDKGKVKSIAQECVSSPAHFAVVSELDDNVVGAVLAMSSPLMFFERSQASVVMFYTRVPKEGGWMIKRLMTWYKSRPALKYLEFTLEACIDPKVGRFLDKMGLPADMPVHNDIRGKKR